MTKKNLHRIVSLCLVICLCFSLTACFGKDDTDPTGGQNGESATYTLSVKTEGGMALEDITVYVYTDATMADLVAVEKTGENGAISFQAPKGTYVAVLQDVPEGYLVEENYPITGETTEIVLAVQLVEGDLSSVTYKLGDVMQDFTFTAADGKQYKLSELLKTKKAVVLNFWYLKCDPCKAEFPYLQEAYTAFSQDIEVLAMNPEDGDDASIAAYAADLGLTFPMGVGDTAWKSAMRLQAYPTTVVIDRFGSIAMIHEGTVPDTQTFTDIFTFFTSDDYVQTTVNKLEDIATSEPQTGTATNPTEIGGVTEFEVTVEPGKLVYVNAYKVDKMYLTIQSSDAYVVFEDETYKPSNGTVGLMLSCPDTYTPAYLGFGNSGTETQTFKVNLSPLSGTFSNPYSMSLGEFTVKVSAGNEQGVYYKYTATKEGQLTLVCLSASSGVEYDFSLFNTNNSQLRNYGGDGKQVDGRPAVTMDVRKGQSVLFSVGTLPDSANVYPAGSFTFKASFSAGEVEEAPVVETMTYAVTVTDADRKPIQGVQINLQVEGKSQAIRTNEKGIAGIALPAGTYPATVVLPLGYKASTTQFQLTEAKPTVAVKLDRVVVEKQTYTVNVTDENGMPLEGVLVAVGGVYGNTDASGAVSFQLPKADYMASVVAPNGYIAEAGYAFASGETALTVKLTAGSGSGENDPNKVAYTVAVTDYHGVPQTGVLVQIYKGGKLVAMQTVDSQGVVTAYLEKGSYTVSLAFPEGTQLYYEERTATLTSSMPALTVRVAAGVDADSYEEVEGSAAYSVAAGGTYVQLPNAVNYFLFTPSEAGTYDITTSDPDAQIQYWGGTFFPNNQTPAGGYENNIFSANVKPSRLGVEYLLAVTGGTEDCILIITRTGDAVLDESDLEPVPYEAKTAPKSFTYTGSGTLTYVDLTSSHKAVYSAADGYYHLDSASGPVLYMNLGPNAPYVSMYNMLGFTGVGGTSFYKITYDDQGIAISKEDYVPCMSEYIACIDANLGIYPLTEDLIYMMQHGGSQKGWWDSENGNYLFADLSKLAVDCAWMFNCCYFK